MSKRFFTADFHLGMEMLLDKNLLGENARPFENILLMNQALIDECNKKASVYVNRMPMLDSNGKLQYSISCYFDEKGLIVVDRSKIVPLYKTEIVDKDTIIHIGDLACFKSDRGLNGISLNPLLIILKIHAQFINVRGNHDVNNKVKNACNCMQILLGKTFPNVTVGHYPSYDIHAKDTFKEGWIHLCGHVHKAWKHALDVTNQVLNINCGVDVWNYQIVSEDLLIQYIKSVLKMPREKLNRFLIVDGKAIRL